MTIASGIFKTITYKEQAAKGVAASGTGGISLPRTNSTLSLQKESYRSNDIKPSQQRSGTRHGAKSVTGQISGDLIVGVHKNLEEYVLRQTYQAAATTGAITTVTASASAPHFVRSSGSFLTDGFKIGDVVRWTGFGAGDNNNRNYLITALTDTDMTVTALDGTAVVAEAEGASVTCTLAGKKTWIPSTGHLRKYVTVEHYFSDIGQSELFTDCVFGDMNVNLPPTGMATVEFPIMGLDMTAGTSQVLTSPTTATEYGNIASVNGMVMVNGTAVALLTGLTISVNGNMTLAEPNVGSDVRADVFPGPIDVTGNATVYFQDGTMRDYFLNETEVSLIAVFTVSNAADSHFKAYVLPKVKLGGADKDDGEKGLVQTMPFSADEMTGSTTYINSTISIQDSSVA